VRDPLGLLDAIEHAHAAPSFARAAQPRLDDPEPLVVLPERAVKLSGSAREILALVDGKRTAIEIAAAVRGRHPDVARVADDVHDFLDEMVRLGVLERGARRERSAPLQPDRRAHLPLSAALRVLLEPDRLSAACATRSTAPRGRACSARRRRSAPCTSGSPAASRRCTRSRADRRGRERGLALLASRHGGHHARPRRPRRARARGAAQRAALDPGRGRGRVRQIAGPSASTRSSRSPRGARARAAAHAERRAAPAQPRARRRDRALAQRLGRDRGSSSPNAQYQGWALRNRAALLAHARAARRCRARGGAAARRDRDVEILFVLPDYHRDRPKPCMGGWGRQSS
jgi:hypothetical protein